MIIYSGSKADFMTEVEEDTIAYSIRDSILKKMHRRTSDAEFNELQTCNEQFPLVHLLQFADQLALVKY